MKEYNLSIRINVPNYWTYDQLEQYIKKNLAFTEITHMMIENIKELKPPKGYIEK